MHDSGLPGNVICTWYVPRSVAGLNGLKVSDAVFDNTVGLLSLVHWYCRKGKFGTDNEPACPPQRLAGVIGKPIPFGTSKSRFRMLPQASSTWKLYCPGASPGK